MSALPRINQRQAVDYIGERKPFVASELSGRAVVSGRSVMPMWLTKPHAADDLAVFNADKEDIRYVVYSFRTPIAWWTETRGWYRVKARFSVITSTKHQSRLYLIGDAR